MAVSMYIRPAEWRKNKTIWLGWPWDESLWCEDLLDAQREFIDLMQALKNEHVMVLVPNAHEQSVVAKRLRAQPHVSITIMPFGDIWLRDTFPIFVRDEHDRIAAVLPRFNGWGEKYAFADDLVLSERIANLLKVPSTRSTLVFEGGAIECDGAGVLLTTEQCLLNKNRNPSVSKADIEKELLRCFGAKKIIWIKEGLKNDHTDGHIDTIARFIAPGTIAIMMPKDQSDPNYQVMKAIDAQLQNETDSNGKKFTIVHLPSPHEIKNSDGKLMPASYLNFIIGDETVVMPLYGSAYDEEALLVLAAQFSMPVIGVSAQAILTGGGAFHCISQEYFR